MTKLSSAAAVCILQFMYMAGTAHAAVIIVQAAACQGSTGGHTEYWLPRAGDGKEAWGLKGEGATGEVHEGEMWYTAFPGADGDYKVEFGVILEPDGDPEYRVSAGARVLGSGRLPYPNGSRQCDEGSVRAAYLNLGVHPIKKGDRITVWGRSVYYCGSAGNWHGAYTRWYEVKFTSLDSSGSEPTQILLPDTGAELIEGMTYSLTGNGANLLWSYDANSDGKGEIPIGSGSSVEFTVPTGVNSPRTLQLILSGDNGRVTQQHTIVAGGPAIRITHPNGGERFSVGDSVTITWTADRRVTDVNIFFSPDAGLRWIHLNTGSAVSSTSPGYAWEIPMTLETSQGEIVSTTDSECLIRVMQYESTAAELRDVSDAYFSVGALATRREIAAQPGRSVMTGTGRTRTFLITGEYIGHDTHRRNGRRVIVVDTDAGRVTRAIR